MVSTINGDPTCRSTRNWQPGPQRRPIPVVAFSVGEEELRGTTPSRWSATWPPGTTSVSLKNPRTTSSSRNGPAPKAKGIAGRKGQAADQRPDGSDHIGIYMWKQAVEKGQVDRHRQGDRRDGGQTFKAPGGFTSKMDAKNHHLHKPVFIGEVQADGQFNVVWKTKGPGRPTLEPFIPATTRGTSRMARPRSSSLDLTQA